MRVSLLTNLLSTSLFLFWSLLLPAISFCQTLPLDTGFLSSALDHAKQVYSNSLGAQSHLYNGVQYKEHNATPDDTWIPYFESDDWVEGSVSYDGQVYDHVPIMYDIVNDKVIIEHGTRGVKLELINQKLEYFTLPGHHFLHLVRDTLKNSIQQSGYYDLLGDGTVQFLVKWRKTRQEVVDPLQIRIIFLENSSFFIRKNGSR